MRKSRKQLLNESRQKIRLFEGLFEANAAVTSSLDKATVLNLVMEKARELLDADAASIFLINEKTDELILEVSTNIPPALYHIIRFPKGKGVAGWVARYGKSVIIEDLTTDPRYFSGVHDVTGFQTKAYICVPLIVQGRIIGTAQVLNRKTGGVFSKEDLHILEGFARQAAIAIENARLHAEELEMKRLEEELELAHRIQNNLLPQSDPVLSGYDISGISHPCRWVGGDYFDFIGRKDGSLAIVIADVCGKGIPAAVMMSTIQAVLNLQNEQDLAIEPTIVHLNRYLCRNTASDKFVTLFYGILDPRCNAFNYINCGHNPPFLLHQDGSSETLAEGGLILGVMEEAEYVIGKVELKSGDLFLMFTDGITEVHNAKKEMFSEKRLLRMAKEFHQVSAKEIVDKTLHSVKDFAVEGQMEDDVTLICVKRRNS